MIELPENCALDRGKVQLSQGECVEIPIETDGLGATTIEAAIWWPETRPGLPGGGRNHVELTVEDPNGNPAGQSAATNTVFQRATVTRSSLSGAWKLKLTGANVPGEPLDIYWAVAIR